MTYTSIKRELFYLKKVFLEYKKGFRYLYNKHIVVKKLLRSHAVLEKPVNLSNLSIHILTGHRDVPLLFWSLASFYSVTEKRGPLFIHSDGSIKNSDKCLLKTFFPNAAIIDPNDFLSQHLFKLDNYPVIKKFRIQHQKHPFVKKLIDPYFVSNASCRLILDSDLLWFKPPNIIQQQIDQGCPHSFMMYSSVPCAVFFKDGAKLNETLAHFNAGIVLYAKENFDLKKLTEYLEKIDFENPASNYFIEQAGHAFCLKKLENFPKETYHIKKEVHKDTIVRHYTGPRRPMFFIEGVEILKHKLL